MSRVAIYARFSSNMQRDASIEDQVRICAERAERDGWTVTQTFTDMAISGASTNRPGLQSLIEQAERGAFDIILAEAMDRISRDQADIAALYKRFSFYGVRIVTLSEGDVGELHVGLKGTMNQLFLKDLAAKTRRGLRGRVEAGRSGEAMPMATMSSGASTRTASPCGASAPSILPKSTSCAGSSKPLQQANHPRRSHES